jgi:hypothetical protein
MPSQELFDRAYSQRALVVKLLVVMCSRLGYDYGWGIDDNEDWEMEWRHVMYVQLPEGQFSWHIAPQDQPLFHDISKQFNGKWDGSYKSRDINYVSGIHPNNVSHLVPGWEKEYADYNANHPDDGNK